MPLSPFPVTHPVVMRSLMSTDTWRRWFNDLWTVVNRCTLIVVHEFVPLRSSAIPETPVQLREQIVPGALYRVTGHTRGVRTSPTGKAEIHLLYMLDGVEQDLTLWVPVTSKSGNNGTQTIRIDAGTTPRFYSTYTGGTNPGGPYNYETDLIIEVMR